MATKSSICDVPVGKGRGSGRLKGHEVRSAAKAKEPSIPEESAAVLRDVLKKLKQQVKSPDFKVTLADYLRLVQHVKEEDAMQAREIAVSWVEPKTKSS